MPVLVAVVTGEQTEERGGVTLAPVSSAARAIVPVLNGNDACSCR